jgi:leucyl-tRNA synthetase
MADVKPFLGIYRCYAEHPFTKDQFQFGLVIILAGYGTGAVAVPCGDERDYAFAISSKEQNGI